MSYHGGDNRSPDLSRRSFLHGAAVLPGIVPAQRRVGGQSMAVVPPSLPISNGVRLPELVRVRLADNAMVRAGRTGARYQGPGFTIDLSQSGDKTEEVISVSLETSRNDITHIQLRFGLDVGRDPLVLADAWERSYGELGWQILRPERALPWYFLLSHGGTRDGFGVRVQPSGLCFWQADAEGVSLWIDIRNGGEPALLAGRRLTLCGIVMTHAPPGLSDYHVLQDFCRRMCPAPNLPSRPIIGTNDWNYAYGRNTAAGILRDADTILELAPSGLVPFVVIDDGWQDRSRFPDLTGLAQEIEKKGATPGIWVRPLRPKVDNEGALLPTTRFGVQAGQAYPAYDPSVPSGLAAAVQHVAEARSRGFQFIKHDFSSSDIFGQWGATMESSPARPGWRFGDRTRTTAEILIDFYQSLRRAAGRDGVMLGCNTFGHLAAGIFESQRIGDDTSGRDWERTRRFGVNALSFRIAQHRRFFHVDPDIVAITNTVPLNMTEQWLNLVAKTGTSLFLALQPNAISPAVKSSVRRALEIARQSPGDVPQDLRESSTPTSWISHVAGGGTEHYRWVGDTGVDPFQTPT